MYVVTLFAKHWPRIAVIQGLVKRGVCCVRYSAGQWVRRVVKAHTLRGLCAESRVAVLQQWINAAADPVCCVRLSVYSDMAILLSCTFCVCTFWLKYKMHIWQERKTLNSIAMDTLASMVIYCAILQLWWSNITLYSNHHAGEFGLADSPMGQRWMEACIPAWDKHYMSKKGCSARCACWEAERNMMRMLKCNHFAITSWRVS